MNHKHHFAWARFAVIAAGLVPVSGTYAQTTVTLNGHNYKLTAHPRVWLDGPSGPLTVSLQDTTNRAQSRNPAYAAMALQMDYALRTGFCSTGANKYSGYRCPGIGAQGITGGDPLSLAADAAVLWYAQGAKPSDPHGYLAFAKYVLGHLEDAASSSFACDETKAYCGRTPYDIFNPMLMYQAWQAYSIVRSQMTPEEIATFVGKALNDNSTSANGIGGSQASPTTGCAKQTITAGTGTISVAGNVITGTGTSFTTQLVAGDVIFAPGKTYEIGTVYQIVSDTKLITTTTIYNRFGGKWSYAAPWATGDCGLLWLEKHHGVCPHITPGQESTYTSNYPPDGGSGPTDDNNIESMCLAFDIHMGLALADDDTRAGTLLTQGYNYYYNYMYPKLKMGWNGFNQGGSQYGVGVWGVSIPDIAVAIKNSVINGPPIASGHYLAGFVPLTYFGAQPNNANYTGAVWGDGGGGAGSRALHNLRGAFNGCYLLDGPAGTTTSECSAFYNYLRRVRGDFTAGDWNEGKSSYAWQFYIFFNSNGEYATPQTSQYVFKDWDLTYSQCTSTFTGTSPVSTFSEPCIPGGFWGGMISLSDWTRTSTQLLVKSGFEMQGQDHTSGLQQGAFHIFRNAYLLAGDQDGGDGFMLDGVTWDNMIDLNNTWVQQKGGYTNDYFAAYVPVIRWSSTDPGGDSLSRYAYEMLELASMYGKAGKAKRVQRQIVHFKKSGGQDYIVTWDDIALSSAIAIAPKAYFHYYLNHVPPDMAISYSGTDYTVSNLQKSRRALLNSKFIPTAGANTAALVVDNPNGRYKGGSGLTYRAYMCPSTDGTTINNSATSGEWAGVFQPINGTNGSMPSISQLTPTESSNFRVIQIADSTWPKVAYFATGGSIGNTALHVATTYSGTGQNLITGLATGTAVVTVGGTPVTGSPFTVNAGDNTVYWEGPAGAVVVTETPSGHR